MAEVDYFLKIDGIPGESQDDEHKDEIEVVSWYWSERLNGFDLGSAGGTGKLKMEDFDSSQQGQPGAFPRLRLR